jgi:hypothetical protein
MVRYHTDAGGAPGDYVQALAPFYANAGLNVPTLTASQAIFTDGSKNAVSVAADGTGNVVRASVVSGAAFRQLLEGWWQDNVAASQTAVVLSRWASGTTAPFAAVMLRAGSITGVYVLLNDTRAAGTLTVEVFKNGSGTGLTAVLDGTNTSFKATTQAKGLDTFVAGDSVDVRVTTDGSWGASTIPGTDADIRAGIEVSYTGDVS